MGIQSKEWNQASAMYMDSLRPVQTEDDGTISIVALTVQGVRGGPKKTKRAKKYEVLIDVRNIRYELPTVWVIAPPDHKIRHVNIYPPEHCDITGQPLPYLCWGTYPSEWKEADQNRRTLIHLLQYVQQHLNNPYFKDPAR